MQIGNDAPDGRRLLILANAGEVAIAFQLAGIVGGPWTPLFDTTAPDGRPVGRAAVPSGGGLRLPERALLVLARDMTGAESGAA